MNSLTPLKVCVVTASRSEYGLMRWIIRDLADDPRFEMLLLVTGAHLSQRHGYTIDEIRADGFLDTFDVPVEFGQESTQDLGQALGQTVIGVTAVLARTRPDIVLVLGDRWEMLGIASACTILNIPIGHFSGGEITEGALDDNIRHALTKLSHLHFVANTTYADRIHQMGEEKWRITVCGGPGIDNFTRLPLMDPKALSADLGLDITRPTAVVTLHPSTNLPGTAEKDATELVVALEAAHAKYGLQYVITGPCPDFGADRIEAVVQGYIRRSGLGIYRKSLGQIRYLSLLKAAVVMIGNSSSAFHEAPVGGLWAVNIGDRQKGRISGGNVISVPPESAAITDGISKAIESGRGHIFPCPYGSGSASPQVRNFLLEVFGGEKRNHILRKLFIDQSRTASQCTN